MVASTIATSTKCSIFRLRCPRARTSLTLTKKAGTRAPSSRRGIALVARQGQAAPVEAKPLDPLAMAMLGAWVAARRSRHSRRDVIAFVLDARVSSRGPGTSDEMRASRHRQQTSAACHAALGYLLWASRKIAPVQCPIDFKR